MYHAYIFALQCQMGRPIGINCVDPGLNSLAKAHGNIWLLVRFSNLISAVSCTWHVEGNSSDEVFPLVLEQKHLQGNLTLLLNGQSPQRLEQRECQQFYFAFIFSLPFRSCLFFFLFKSFLFIYLLLYLFCQGAQSWPERRR